ncbi:hypothetical protein ACQ4LE_006801 [Meloidogyne hapla]
MGPFLLCSIKATFGDSGASVWSHEGLVGLTLGFTDFPTYSHKMAIDEAARFDKQSFIVSIDRINEGLKKLEAKEKVPAKSTTSTALCFTLPGVGTFMGIPDE